MVDDPASWEEGSGGYGYNAVYLGGTPADAFRPSRPARVPHPSRTLMFATTALAKSSGLQEYPFAEPRQWIDPNGNPGGPLQPSVHFRFRGKALVAWCDGHVSEVSMSDSSELNYYGGSNEDEDIGFPGPAEANGWWNPQFHRRGR
jgi:prepilin-type processing-associated H-X9-DG protein